MARNRSTAISITNNEKIRISTQIGLTGNSQEDDEKITHYLEEKMKNENKYNNVYSFKNEYQIDVVPPTYLDIKKEYYTKHDKPILFHEKAKIIDCLDKKFVGDIEPYSQHIDFHSFLSQFKNEEEVNNLEIQDLLNIDFEKLGCIKEKATEFIQNASNLAEAGNEQGEDSLLIFLCEKLNDIKRNERNIQLFINNIDRVEGIIFGENKTQVNFTK